MPSRLLQTALFCAVVFVFAANVLGMALAETPLAMLALLPGLLMTPGIGLVYGLFDVNNHDLLPLVMAELANVLVYWIIFIPLLALFRRKAR